MTLGDRLAALEAENATLREQLAAALAEIQERNGQRAKDSHNSRKPPVVFSYLIASTSRHRAPPPRWPMARTRGAPPRR